MDYHNTSTTPEHNVTVNGGSSLSDLDSMYDVPRRVGLAPLQPPPPCSSTAVKVHKYINAASKIVSTEGTTNDSAPVSGNGDAQIESDVFVAGMEEMPPRRPPKPRNLSDPTTLDGTLLSS